MKRLPLLVLATATAAVAVPALAGPVVIQYGANAPSTTYVWDPATRTYVEQQTVTHDSAPIVVESVPSARDEWSADRTPRYSVPQETATTRYYAPAGATVTTRYSTPSDTAVYTPAEPTATVRYYSPADATYNDEIIVTAPRASEDELITADVADRIAADPHVNGRVGVDTYRNNVTLTGRVTTQGQVDRAERDARAADGVRDVENRLRSSVGNF